MIEWSYSTSCNWIIISLVEKRAKFHFLLPASNNAIREILAVKWEWFSIFLKCSSDERESLPTLTKISSTPRRNRSHLHFHVDYWVSTWDTALSNCNISLHTCYFQQTLMSRPCSYVELHFSLSFASASHRRKSRSNRLHSFDCWKISLTVTGAWNATNDQLHAARKNVAVIRYSETETHSPKLRNWSSLNTFLFIFMLALSTKHTSILEMSLKKMFFSIHQTNSKRRVIQTVMLES